MGSYLDWFLKSTRMLGMGAYDQIPDSGLLHLLEIVEAVTCAFLGLE